MDDPSDPERLPTPARRVARFLADAGHPHAVVLLPDSARSAAEAAAALDCDVAQIVKSIVFRRADGGAVVVATSGATRVDERRLAAAVGEVGRADASFVKAATGYSIGGVSPFGLPADVLLLVDGSLAGLDPCWCAAGHPHAVVRCSIDDLLAQPGALAVAVS